MNEQSLILLLNFIGGLYVGWLAREKYAQIQVNRMLEDNEISFHENEDEEVICNITIEEHNNIFFAYKYDDHSFMGTGESMELLAQELLDKYPEFTKFQVITDESV